MMSFKIRSRQSTPIQQITRRLSEIDALYSAVRDADSIETAKRLERLRYGVTAPAYRDV